MHMPLAHVALKMLEPSKVDMVPPLEATIALFVLAFVANVMLTSPVTSLLFGCIVEPETWLNCILWASGPSHQEAASEGKLQLDSTAANNGAASPANNGHASQEKPRPDSPKGSGAVKRG